MWPSPSARCNPQPSCPRGAAERLAKQSLDASTQFTPASLRGGAHFLRNLAKWGLMTQNWKPAEKAVSFLKIRRKKRKRMKRNEKKASKIILANFAFKKGAPFAALPCASVNTKTDSTDILTTEAGVVSYDECHWLCIGNAQCTFFEWNEATKDCVLKVWFDL